VVLLLAIGVGYMNDPDKKYRRLANDIEDLLDDLESIKQTGFVRDQLRRPENCREDLLKEEVDAIKNIIWFCKIFIDKYDSDFLEGIKCE
jgi:hypothetical protein